MEVFIFILVSVGVLAGVGFLLYYSVQSLRQAKCLKTPVPLEALKENLDKPVAVHGRPFCESPAHGPSGEDVIWYKREHQVYRRSYSGKSSSGSWRTTDAHEIVRDFEVHFPDGGRVRIACEPSEVHGTSRHVEKRGFFSNTRTLHRWLPLTPEMTVLGRLALSGEGATLVKDPRVGMLLTCSSPGRAALIEYAKGIGGIVLSVAVVAGGVVILILTAS